MIHFEHDSMEIFAWRKRHVFAWKMMKSNSNSNWMILRKIPLNYWDNLENMFHHEGWIAIRLGMNHREEEQSPIELFWCSCWNRSLSRIRRRLRKQRIMLSRTFFIPSQDFDQICQHGILRRNDTVNESFRGKLCDAIPWDQIA